MLPNCVLTFALTLTWEIYSWKIFCWEISIFISLHLSVKCSVCKMSLYLVHIHSDVVVGMTKAPQNTKLSTFLFSFHFVTLVQYRVMLLLEVFWCDCYCWQYILLDVRKSLQGCLINLWSGLKTVSIMFTFISLLLNVEKTKEIEGDFRKKETTLSPLRLRAVFFASGMFLQPYPST